jgi:hypothetical protein
VCVYRFRLFDSEWEPLGDYESDNPYWFDGDTFVSRDGRPFRIVKVVPFPADFGIYQAFWKVESTTSER